MKEETSSIYAKIGRKVLCFSAFLSVLLFLFIVPLTALLVTLIFTGEGSMQVFYKNIFDDIHGNYLFLLVQFIVMLASIWWLGPRLARQIIQEKKNYYWISVWTIFLLWMMLLISCSLTSGVEGVIQYGWSNFWDSLGTWLFFGVIPFITMGIFNGLVIGYFSGKRIQLEGEALPF